MSAVVDTVAGNFSPSPSQLALAYSVCRGIARTAAKNFYYAFMVLPRPKRRALCAVYAYMRHCDDITDGLIDFARGRFGPPPPHLLIKR